MALKIGGQSCEFGPIVPPVGQHLKHFPSPNAIVPVTFQNLTPRPADRCTKVRLTHDYGPEWLFCARLLGCYFRKRFSSDAGGLVAGTSTFDLKSSICIYECDSIDYIIFNIL